MYQILKLRINDPTNFKHFVEHTHPSDPIQIFYDYPEKIVLTTLNTDRKLTIKVDFLLAKDEIETTTGVFNLARVMPDIPLILFISVKDEHARPSDISLFHYQKLSNAYSDEYIERDIVHRATVHSKL